MDIKFSLWFVSMFLMIASGLFAQQKISILGDSYSTFYGYVTPDTNLCWYAVPMKRKKMMSCKLRKPGGIIS